MASASKAKDLIATVRALEIPEPVLAFRDAAIALFEHHVVAALEVPVSYESWRTKNRYLVSQVRMIAGATPADALKQAFPLLQIMATVDLTAPIEKFSQMILENMLDKTEDLASSLAEVDRGERTLAFLRALDVKTKPEHKNAFVEALATAARTLDDDPRDNLLADAVLDFGMPGEAEWLINSGKYIGDLYESRGKVILEMLWAIMFRTGWFRAKNPDACRYPDGGHDEIMKRVKKYLREYADVLPRPHWRRWRNAASHKNGLTSAYTDAGYVLRVYDMSKHPKVKPYNKTFTAVQVGAELVAAINMLEHFGAFEQSIVLLNHEKLFDRFNHQKLDKLLKAVFRRFV